MNRFKKELRKKGVKLECDYKYLPCGGIECVNIDSENALVKIYHNCYGWSIFRINRAFSEFEEISDY